MLVSFREPIGAVTILKETTGEENKLADSHVASTSLAGEDHSQEETHGSSAHVQRVRAGCPEKYAASGRGGVFLLDISFHRTTLPCVENPLDGISAHLNS